LGGVQAFPANAPGFREKRETDANKRKRTKTDEEREGWMGGRDSKPDNGPESESLPTSSLEWQQLYWAAASAGCAGLGTRVHGGRNARK
jgi:hypothetical protein